MTYTSNRKKEDLVGHVWGTIIQVIKALNFARVWKIVKNGGADQRSHVPESANCILGLDL